MPALMQVALDLSGLGHVPFVSKAIRGAVWRGILEPPPPPPGVARGMAARNRLSALHMGDDRCKARR